MMQPPVSHVSMDKDSMKNGVSSVIKLNTASKCESISPPKMMLMRTMSLPSPPLPPNETLSRDSAMDHSERTAHQPILKDKLDTVMTETLRRPRAAPPTPRLQRQREYSKGDRVEVMDTTRGICRAWLSATVLDLVRMKDLSLTPSASPKSQHNTQGASRQIYAGHPFLSTSQADAARRARSSDMRGPPTDMRYSNADSPRTVRSPVSSAPTSTARIRYIVELEYKIDERKKHKVREEVLASQMRPIPPVADGQPDKSEWKPEVGDAVEVLNDCAWCIAVIQNFLLRKGHLVSFESGHAMWVRRPLIRPYQIWRGGDCWVTKTKPPLPVVRKSVGLSVTHPPGGKRKLVDDGDRNIDIDMDSKGGQVMKQPFNRFLNGTGPDGLPEGWRREQIKLIGNGGYCSLLYVAPDGHRLKSLKEAQRYVRMMGPS